MSERVSIPVLFAVISYAGDIRVVKARRCPGFAQEPRPGNRICRYRSIDDFECDGAIQHGIAGTKGYRHRPRAQLNWKAVLTNFDFKMSVAKGSRRNAIIFFAPVRCGRLVIWKKGRRYQATHTFSVRSVGY
jgi:hypothetical protein